MRGIFQPPALIIQRALYDGPIHAEANGVTLDSHPEVLADRLATGMISALLAIVGAPASAEEIRGMARAALERQIKAAAHPVQTFGREEKGR